MRDENKKERVKYYKLNQLQEYDLITWIQEKYPIKLDKAAKKVAEEATKDLNFLITKTQVGTICRSFGIELLPHSGAISKNSKSTQLIEDLKEQISTNEGRIEMIEDFLTKSFQKEFTTFMVE